MCLVNCVWKTDQRNISIFKYVFIRLYTKKVQFIYCDEKYNANLLHSSVVSFQNEDVKILLN